MHEYAILDAILTRIDQEAAKVGAQAVHRVELRIGEQSGVEISLLETAWDTLGKHGLTEQAALVIHPQPVAWVCRFCTNPIAPGGPLRCVVCGGPGLMVGGDEIVLERLELEVSDV